MTKLTDKTVLITGASSGIGKSCATYFAQEGARLILVARRKDRLDSLAQELKNKFQTKILAQELDVRDRKAVEEFISSLPKEWTEIDILVNNAGLARGRAKIYEGDWSDWDEMIDTNVKGLLAMSRAVLQGMIARNRGHIINIGSIAGHEPYPGGNVYNVTKFGVHALTRGMRMDLSGTKIRVSSVDPGMVETEFSIVRFHGNKDEADRTYEGMKPLTPDDIAEVVLFVATRPPHVDIQDVLVMPTDQASATIVSRE